MSAPLRWEELDAGFDPAVLTMEAVLARVARDGDLFAPLLAGRQCLDRALRSVA